MFEPYKKRYLTSGIDTSVPYALQLFIWSLIDHMPEPKDYFQIFTLTAENNLQIIHHHSEEPPYSMKYILTTIESPLTDKIYVIDDGINCTMLFANEY